MATDGDHFVGQVAAADLADDVVRGVLARVLGGDVQAQLHRLAAAEHVHQQVGVGIGQGGRRDARHALVVAHGAGVGEAVGVGADRADHHRHRALLRRLDRAAAACADGRAVTAAVLEAHHAVGDEGDLALEAARRRRFQRGQVGEGDHLGLQRALGADAAAQRRDHQRLRIRRHHFGALVAAQPHREGHRLEVDAVEAQGLELGLGPAHRLGVGRGTGQARADLGGERLDDVEGLAARQGLVAQRGGHGEVAGVQAGAIGSHGGQGGQQGQGEQVAGKAHRGLRQGDAGHGGRRQGCVVAISAA